MLMYASIELHVHIRLPCLDKMQSQQNTEVPTCRNVLSRVSTEIVEHRCRHVGLPVWKGFRTIKMRPCALKELLHLEKV